ncbi:hypothetical protein B0F90DRAFT_1668486 [Multifurca ochricompacta]|uniref:Uncharacterized protein n=1 Tax=Multifurca ochricompacta TaxID=376703 RepID=A0AAD4M2Y1_9AGAM|nr:hypothetical protein B0F90DRAFT_1668486 [Multifurca ochricompacta]
MFASSTTGTGFRDVGPGRGSGKHMNTRWKWEEMQKKAPDIWGKRQGNRPAGRPRGDRWQQAVHEMLRESTCRMAVANKVTEKKPCTLDTPQERPLGTLEGACHCTRAKNLAKKGARRKQDTREDKSYCASGTLEALLGFNYNAARDQIKRERVDELRVPGAIYFYRSTSLSSLLSVSAPIVETEKVSYGTTSWCSLQALLSLQTRESSWVQSVALISTCRDLFLRTVVLPLVYSMHSHELAARHRLHTPSISRHSFI